MGLVPSGAIAIKDDTLQGGSTSIALEVDGDTTGDKHLATLGATAGLSAGGTSMSEFYEYGWGRVYFVNSYVDPAHIKRVTQGDTYVLLGSSAETLMFSENQDESTRIDKDDSGGSFISGDNLFAFIYRRTKLTGGGWGTELQTWFPYLSESYACDFDTYDYKWELTP